MKKNAYWFIFLCLLCINGHLYAQKSKELNTKFYSYKNQLGINATNVLGNLLSLNPTNVNSPYLLTYRRHLGGISFRSGIYGGASSSEDFSGSDQKKLKTFDLSARIGFEKHFDITPKILVSVGLDFLYNYGSESSEVITFLQVPPFNTRSFVSKENSNAIGMGPIFRFEYKINDRIYLSTEANLYGIYGKKSENLSVDQSPVENLNSNFYNVDLQIPQSLFINFAF